MRDLSAGIWEKSLMKMVQESLDWSSYCFFFIFQKNDSQFPPTSSVLATICLSPVWKIDDDDYNVPVLTNSDKIIDKQENGPPCCLRDLTYNQWKHQNPYLLPGLRLKTLRSLSGDVSSQGLRNRPLPQPLWHNQPTHVAPNPHVAPTQILVDFPITLDFPLALEAKILKIFLRIDSTLICCVPAKDAWLEENAQTT